MRRWTSRIEGGGRAEAGLGRVGADRDALAFAMLVGLGAADGEQEALVGDALDVAQVQTDEFGVAECSAGAGRLASIRRNRPGTAGAA